MSQWFDNMKIFYGSLLLLIFFSYSCSNDLEEVNAITNEKFLKIEEAKFVTILYSDSAQVRVRITADKMVRHLDKKMPRDEFPEGIYVEFLGESGKPYSWLEADRATRYEKDSEVIAQGNARFYNRKKEMLTSTELIWNENDQKLRTNKFVRITQPIKGDTSYGYGFEANEEFTLFEIKRKTSSIFNIEDLKNLK
ncbi:MAG: LPS export ABC transporter periplasmic protein LptC [Saprospiraceae bacterium]|nr:LPS export ABC transporter periplasmic protein LptC [Saprospiraceae bacterium]